MKNTFILSLTISLISLSSCKKDKADHISESKNYSQLKAGNYWIYQTFIIDTLGHERETPYFDSCYIEKDTVINNQVYYKMVRPEYSNSSQIRTTYLRDSLHYIIDHRASILFSHVDFTSVFREYYFIPGLTKKDTMFRSIRKMDNADFITHTPAGTFSTLSMKETFYMYTGFARTKRYMVTKYCDKIGIVAETIPFFFSDIEDRERRLVRYRVH